MELQTFVLSPFQSNCYVLSSSLEQGASAVVIDPGDIDMSPVLNYIHKNGLRVEAVWATHAHVDHVMGVDVVRKEFGVPAYVHEADAVLWSEMAADAKRWLSVDVPTLAPPDAYLGEGDCLSCGDMSFIVWHTPGHSRGSICLIGDEIAFTGDTLFAQGVGRTDLPGGSWTHLNQSLHRLLELPGQIRIYPGHMGSSTMSVERQINPFLQDLDE